jgi:hypothetical protein
MTYPQKDNLSTFRILFLIKGILSMVAALFFLMYFAMANMFDAMIEHAPAGQRPPFNPSDFMRAAGIIGFVVFICIGTVTLLASKYLKDVTNYTFIFVVAAINCITGILGILLAVFTMIELTKPHVKEMFQRQV